MRKHKVCWHRSKRWRFTHTAPDRTRRTFYASPEIPQTEAGRRKATEWMEAVLRSLEDRVVAADGWTLEDLRRLYLDWVKQRVGEGEAAQETYDDHRKCLGLICNTPWGGATFGHLEARSLTTKDVNTLMKAWKDEGRSPTTRRNRIGSLQAMLNWAARPRDDRPLERLLEVNPIAGIALPKPEYEGDRYAPAEEVEAFIAWAERRAATIESKEGRFERMLAALIRTAAETGARPKELCRLEWRHYDPATSFIVFPPNEHKTGRKTKRPRFLYVTERVAVILETLRADPAAHPTHVFTHRAHIPGRKATPEERLHGIPWNSNALSKRVKEMRLKAIKEGVKIEDTGVKRMHLYRLRHTKITNDIQAGENIADIAAQHGNSIGVIQSTYLHTQLTHLGEVGKRLEEKRRRTSGA